MRPDLQVGGTEAPRGLVFGSKECGWQGTDWGFGPRQTGVSLGASIVATRAPVCV